MRRSRAAEASDDDELSVSGVSHSTRGRRGAAAAASAGTSVNQEFGKMTASDARKLRKNSRERARRHDLKELFDSLSIALGLDEKSKPEKHMILSLALSTITELSKRVQTLIADNNKLNEEVVELRRSQPSSISQDSLDSELGDNDESPPIAGVTSTNVQSGMVSTQSLAQRSVLQKSRMPSRSTSIGPSNNVSLQSTSTLGSLASTSSSALSSSTSSSSSSASSALITQNLVGMTHNESATTTIPVYGVVTTPTSNSMRTAVDLPTPSAQMAIHHHHHHHPHHNHHHPTVVPSAPNVPPTPAELPTTPANSIGMKNEYVETIANHRVLPTAHYPGPPLSTTSAGTPNALAAMANLKAQQHQAGVSSLHMRSTSIDAPFQSVFTSTRGVGANMDVPNPTSPNIPEAVVPGSSTSPTNMGATMAAASGSASPAGGLNALFCSLTLEQQQGLARGYMPSQNQANNHMRRDSNPSISPSFGGPVMATTPIMGFPGVNSSAQMSHNALATPTRIMAPMSRLHSGTNSMVGSTSITPSPSPSPSNGLANIVLQTLQSVGFPSSSAGASYSPTPAIAAQNGHTSTLGVTGPNLHNNLSAPPSAGGSVKPPAAALAASVAAATIRQTRDTTASISGSVSSSAGTSSSFGSAGIDVRLRGHSTTSSSSLMGVQHPPHHPQHIGLTTGLSGFNRGVGISSTSSVTTASSEEERQRAASTSSTAGGPVGFGASRIANMSRPVGGSGSYKFPYVSGVARPHSQHQVQQQQQQ